MATVLDPLLLTITREYLDNVHLDEFLTEMFEVMCAKTMVIPTSKLAVHRMRTEIKENNLRKVIVMWHYEATLHQATLHNCHRAAGETSDGGGGATSLPYTFTSNLPPRIEKKRRMYEKKLTWAQVCHAFSSTHFGCNIHFTELDYDLITEGGNKADSDGSLGREHFLAILRHQLYDYNVRRLQRAVAEAESSQDLSLLISLKLLITQLDAVHHKQKKLQVPTQNQPLLIINREARRSRGLSGSGMVHSHPWRAQKDKRMQLQPSPPTCLPTSFPPGTSGDTSEACTSLTRLPKSQLLKHSS
jgi:hypothetical protein